MSTHEPASPGSRIVLQPTDMCWILGAENEVFDQCAHGGVVFTIDSITFVGSGDVESVTVSAAALFLLRTLTYDHTPATPGSRLVATCAPVAGSMLIRLSVPQFPVLVMGCPTGTDD